jgi:peptide/nickel transport system substrate-binding protein
MQWKNHKSWTAVTVFLLALHAGCGAHAQTVRVAYQADVLSMDPHALGDTLQLSLTGNVYEPLVGRNKDLSLAPALATSWRQVSPTVWQFALRKDVQFHDGSPFGADDVVFSFARAGADGSGLRSRLVQVKEVRKLDDSMVEIETKAPFPLLPDMLTQVYIMSRRWCEANGAVQPADARQPGGNAATLQANGTGPYQLRTREPNVRTVFERSNRYWGEIEGNAQEVVLSPIGSGAARVAALLSGAVDVAEPIPVQEVERINAGTAARAVTGPEVRTIFLGMDQEREELLFSNVKGRNPFKDKRVRQAFYQAIDVEAIKRTVMHGAASPAALLVGPGINGYVPELNKRLAYDPAAARKLLADAGYTEGFDVAMDCPSDRDVADAAICQAVARDLGRVGVKVRLQTEPKSVYFPKLLRRETSFYMLGWTPSSFDAYDVFNALMACPAADGSGQFNVGGYCNARLDDAVKQIGAAADKAQRNAWIRKAWEISAADIGYIPLHQQALAWGVSRKVKLVQLADDSMYFKWMSIAK